MTLKAEGVLLVEDDPGHAVLAQVALRQCGFPDGLKAVSSGEEALRFLETRETTENNPTPRLVVLDLNSSPECRLAVLVRLKSSPRTRAIPVVVLSTSTREAEITECYEQGANSYLVKPAGTHQLLHMMRVLCTYWLGLNLQADPALGANG